MKAIVLTLPALGLVFGFTAPAGASVGLSLSDATVVSQQSTCKEGEQWDADQNKCVKKEG